MSITRQEPAGVGSGTGVDAGQWDAPAHDFDSEGPPTQLRAQDERMRRERLMEMEERRRAARVKRMHEAMDQRLHERIDRAIDQRLHERIDKRIDEGLRKRYRERLERRRDWYARVGIHRDFARDCAKYMAGVSC